MTFLTVVIPTYNESQSIGLAVGSAWLSGADEVIVVDGESKDGTADVAARAGAHVVETGKGRGRQLQKGVEVSQGQWLIFLHADSQLDAGLRTALEQLPADIHWGCLTQRIGSPRLVFRWIEWGNARRVHWFGLPYGDQAVYVRRQALLSVNGVPTVPIMEDVLLSQKLGAQRSPHVLRLRTGTSSRRWERDGILRRTIGNWRLLYRFLVRHESPERLLEAYRPQNVGSATDD